MVHSYLCRLYQQAFKVDIFQIKYSYYKRLTIKNYLNESFPESQLHIRLYCWSQVRRLVFDPNFILDHTILDRCIIAELLVDLYKIAGTDDYYYILAPKIYKYLFLYLYNYNDFSALDRLGNIEIIMSTQKRSISSIVLSVIDSTFLNPSLYYNICLYRHFEKNRTDWINEYPTFHEDKIDSYARLDSYITLIYKTMTNKTLSNEERIYFYFNVYRKLI
jgi:hypothetical protein